MRNLSLGLMKAPEGEFFTAGLWDADGSWTKPDASHRWGQAKFYGGWHAVYFVKRNMRHLWGIKTGRMSLSTKAGHRSSIGDHVIVTRTNVYSTCVKSWSMPAWIDRVGRLMILKSRFESAGSNGQIGSSDSNPA